MTQTTPERRRCSVCPGEYTVTANGTIRHHFTDNPDFQAGPDSRKCRGAGEPPAGVNPTEGAAPAESAPGPQCRLCKHPGRLTANGRMNSHLTPEAKPRPCPGGSDFPLGTYPDITGTTDGMVATLARDCGHVPAGECYACAGVPVPAELTGEGGGTEPGPEPAETITRTGTNTAAVAAAPTMADQLRAAQTDDFGQPVRECFNCDTVGCAGCGGTPADDGRPEASRFLELLEQETRGAGTVLDVISPAERERLASVVATDHQTDARKAADAETSRLTREAVEALQRRTPEQKAETAARMDRTASAALGVPLDPALNHKYTDPSGIVWVHGGPAETCEAPDCRLLRNCEQCDTDTHRCTGCGADVPHGAVACAGCTARVDAEDAKQRAKCAHPDGFRAPLHVGGKNVLACEHCNAVEPSGCVHPQGFLYVGADENDEDRHACPACGAPDPTDRKPDAVEPAPCTHPDGYGAWDVLDDNGDETTVEACLRCGALASGEVDPDAGPAVPDTGYRGSAEFPDPELPGCPHPETHRAGCGCPDDDSQDPQAREMNTVLAALEAERAGEDAWRTPADLLAKMPEDVRDLDALRLDCATCKHPVTPLVDRFDIYGNAAAVAWGCRDGITSGYRVCRDHECTPDRNVRLGDLDEGDHFVRRGALMRLTERQSAHSVLAEVLAGPHKGREGELKNLDEIVERAPAPAVVAERSEEDQRDAWRALNEKWADQRAKEKTGPVLLGHLETGEHFVRRGVLMRVTGETNGVVHAVVVEGPMKGRTGDLPNLGETVERTYCRHEFSYRYDDIGSGVDHSGWFCDYCGDEDQTKEQETKECPDGVTTRQRPVSSAASAPTASPTTTAPAPGSPRATAASAPAVSPKSQSVTSSAPTAKAAGSDRSAAVTTDQAQAAAAFLSGGRSSVPVQPGAADQSASAVQFLAGGSGAHGEKETKRDRFGRYLIPHPDTGKEQAWTRATTFAKSISDTFTLSQWQGRMILLGATTRPDIVQRAHGKHVKADRKLLNELTDDLKKAAGDKVAANLGTAMHSFTELADRAWHTPEGPRSVLEQVPPDARADVETYIRLLEETGLEPVPHLIEFTTVVKQYDVAGTSDNCYKVTKPLKLKIGRAEVRLNPGEYVIGDKKTGKDLDYGWQEIAIQLAVYAQGLNTSGVWDRHEEVWHPDPLSRFDEPGTKVRTDAGIVVHLPVDSESEKQPAVYGIDLESGWNAAVLCERVRTWRKVRNLASPVTVSEARTSAPARPEQAVTSRTTVRPASLEDRARAVTSKGEASAVGKQAVKDGLPRVEMDRLVAIMQARLAELAEPAG